jgi:hypothetical protein
LLYPLLSLILTSSYGFVFWLCPLNLPYGFTLCHFADGFCIYLDPLPLELLYGFARGYTIWLYLLTISYGFAV